MNAPAHSGWTVEQFLEWEAKEELRHEFDGERPVAMAGVTQAHAEIQTNLVVQLATQLKRPCRVVGSDLKFHLGGRVRYPDAMILCGSRDLQSSEVRDPIVVFEILSEGTAQVDLVQKNAEYRQAPSLQRYVVLEQTRAGAVVFTRRGDEWLSEIVAGPRAVLSLPEVAVELSLAAIYTSLFSEAGPSAAEETVAQ